MPDGVLPALTVAVVWKMVENPIVDTVEGAALHGSVFESLGNQRCIGILWFLSALHGNGLEGEGAGKRTLHVVLHLVGKTQRWVFRGWLGHPKVNVAIGSDGRAAILHDVIGLVLWW